MRSQTFQSPLVKGSIRVPLRVPIWDLEGLGFRGFKHPLIKEYTLNHVRDPSTIQGIFLNQGIFEGLEQ